MTAVIVTLLDDTGMGLFRRFALRRAAKRYARDLGACLVRDFGASEQYTPRQIAAAVRKLRLDGRYIALAYAPFLSQQSFDDLAAEMPVAVSYAEARALYDAFRPASLDSASANAETNIYIATGGAPPP